MVVKYIIMTLLVVNIVNNMIDFPTGSVNMIDFPTGSVNMIDFPAGSVNMIDFFYITG